MCFDSGPGPAADNPSTPGGVPGGFHRNIPGAAGGFVSPTDPPMSDRLSESMIAGGMDPTSGMGRAVAKIGTAAGFPPQSSQSSPSRAAAMGHPVVGGMLSFLGDFFNELEKLGLTVIRGEEAFGRPGQSQAPGFRPSGSSPSGFRRGGDDLVGGGGADQLFVDPNTGLIEATPEARMVAQTIMAEQSRDRAASRASSPQARGGRLSTLLSDTRGERLG